jgi:TonB family protein
VVAVGPSSDDRAPDDARFAADRNQRVEKETVARDRRTGFANPMPRPSAPEAGRRAPAGDDRGSERGRGGDRASQGLADGARRSPPPEPARPDRSERPAEPRLALKLDRFGDFAAGDRAEAPPAPAPIPQRGDPVAPDRGDGTRAGDGALGRSRLQPSAETYERLAGGPAPDHVTGVEEGEGTFLNAREWKYSSYFNRIKESVASKWDPNRALALRDPEGRRFAYRDRHTVVSVRLDDHGGLKDVEVVKSSGVDFLDEVALEAFQKAQPFVNPPGGLADQRGEIVFNFGFYLEVGGGFRMFRAPGAY